MSKKTRKPLYSTAYTTVVVCSHNGCPWRTLTTDRARAWYHLARHLKDSHGDLHATTQARKNAWALQQSLKEDA